MHVVVLVILVTVKATPSSSPPDNGQTIRLEIRDVSLAASDKRGHAGDARQAAATRGGSARGRSFSEAHSQQETASPRRSADDSQGDRVALASVGHDTRGSARGGEGVDAPKASDCLLYPRRCREGMRVFDTPDPSPVEGVAAQSNTSAAYRPRVAQFASTRGLELTRYEDGGRLYRSTGGPPPSKGMLGLLTLASEQLGQGTGQRICDPYRGRGKAGNEFRELVILLDTSSSIKDAGREAQANVCAAGAALAGLARGHRVAVVNFSSTFQFLRATRDENAIYRAVALRQRGGTLLPTSTMTMPGGKARVLPKDFVLITDTAIHNIDTASPYYKRLIAHHAKNRAVLFVLGDGFVCERCAEPKEGEEPCFCEQPTRTPLTQLLSAGFVPYFVDHADGARPRSRQL